MRTIAHATSVETNAFWGASIPSLSMGWFTTHATDDLGNTVELVVGSAGLAKEDPELASVLTRYAESIQPRSGIPPIAFVAAVAGTLTIVIGTQLLPTSLPPWFASLAVGPILLLAFLVSIRSARRRHTSRLIESVLRIGRCPGCGYNLGATPSAPDGICRCPECAAGWGAYRVGRAAVPATELPPVPDMPGDSAPFFGTWASLLARNPTIIDDRDRCVPRVDLALPGIEKELGVSEAAHLRREVRRVTFSQRAGCAGIPTILLVFVVAGLISNIARGRLGLIGVFGALSMLMVTIVYATMTMKTWKGRTRWSSAVLVQTARAHGLCPSCAAVIATRPAEPDGCRICPKCHAAWKIPAAPHASNRTTTSV